MEAQGKIMVGREEFNLFSIFQQSKMRYLDQPVSVCLSVCLLPPKSYKIFVRQNPVAFAWVELGGQLLKHAHIYYLWPLPQLVLFFSVLSQICNLDL